MLYPGAAEPFSCAERYSLNRIVNSGPSRDSNFVSAERGTISPVVIQDIELADVFRFGAVGALGFDVNLPLAPEPVEVVDEIARP